MRTKITQTILFRGKGSLKTIAAARMGTAAPMAALKGITKRARPWENAIVCNRKPEQRK
jgi:hypothetical protein